MKPMKITVGSDPELMIVDDNGRPCSAIRVLKTDKTNPIKLGKSIKMYADNALVEASFDPVSPAKIVERIRDVLQRMTQALGGYRIMPQAAMVYPDDELKHVLMGDDGHPKLTAWEIGCSDNYGAYRPMGDMVNPKLKFTDGLRTGSFHIHIGNAAWKDGKDDRLMSEESKVNAIKLLDYFLGIPSILFDQDESSPLRRKLYGKAGEFRPTPYGVEYRVLGNFALRSPRLVKLVFDLVQVAMGHIALGSDKDFLKQVDEKAVIHTINKNDTGSALDMLKGMKLAKPFYDEITTKESSTSLEKAWGI